MNANVKNWIKRTGVVLAVAAGGFLAFGPRAEAATTAPQNFIVQTQVNQACTFTSAGLTFSGYTTGTSTPVNGTSAWSVNCPGASATNIIPVYFTMSATGGFVMAGPGGSTLTYALCDGPCASGTPYPNNAAGPNIAINSAPQAYTLNGTIPANQNPAVGSHTQTVAVTMTY